MNKTEFTDKLKILIKDIWASRVKSDDAAFAYDELTKFPELKAVIVDLLTADFDKFLESIDWVAPRPSTFRINLLNGQSFLLSYGGRSWEAQVEGKNYTLINLDEEQRAAKAIARILAYGAKEKIDKEEDTNYEGGGPTGSDTSGADDLDISNPPDDIEDL